MMESTVKRRAENWTGLWTALSINRSDDLTRLSTKSEPGARPGKRATSSLLELAWKEHKAKEVNHTLLFALRKVSKNTLLPVEGVPVISRSLSLRLLKKEDPLQI
jgi:hypothetical protein